MDITNVGKSQYGSYAKLADGKFKGITPQVQAFLTGKTPCTVEVEEESGEGKAKKISKVKITSSNASANTSQKGYDRETERINVDAGNIVQRATELVVDGKEESLDKATGAVILCFKKAQNALLNKEEEHPEPEAETVKPGDF